MKLVGKPVLDNKLRTMQMLEVGNLDDDLQGRLESAGLFVSVKKLKEKTYMRISVWSYNTLDDFRALSEFLNYRLILDSGIGSTEEQRCE
jgi:hypothetical protein